MSEPEHRKLEARRELAVFLVAMLFTTFVSYSLYVRWPRLSWDWWPVYRWVVASWTPAIASILSRLVLRKTFDDVSFGMRGRWVGRAIAIGWLAPLASGLLTYGPVWLSGAARFGPGSRWGPEELFGLHIAAMSPLSGFLIRIAACLLYALFLCLPSAGEEIGWRGFVLTRLYDAKISAPIFWNGLVAGMWWLPFRLHDRRTPEPEPFAISFFFFVAGTIAASYLISYLRLRSGSIWPAVICRASTSSLLGIGFVSFLNANVFVQGEVYLLNFALWVLVLLFVKRPWPFRYSPEVESRPQSEAAP